MPVRENHAIEVMAAVVSFAQPIPDLLLGRILRSSEDIAFEAGLKSRQTTSSMQLYIGPGGGWTALDAASIQGRTFSSTVDAPAGEPVTKQISEQIQVQPNAVIYRTWQYVSWDWQLQRMRLLMAPTLERAESVVSTTSIRLEYLDRFRFDGAPKAASPLGLLREGSSLISPHVFSADDLFHSHTGRFLSDRDGRRRLLQVMIDVLDQPSADGLAQVRWANITTALEDRFEMRSEVETDIDVFGTFESMHEPIKDTLASIIDDTLVNRISLWSE